MAQTAERVIFYGSNKVVFEKPMSEKYALEMEGVGKDYGGRRILDGLTFRVEKGETVSLFGENGSGKTSLLKIASCLAKPNRGKVSVAGFDAVSSPEQIRKRVGFVSHEDCLYESLSAFENLRFFCQLQRVGNPADRARELIESFEIMSPNAPSGNLSAGMKKRISIARSVSHNPEVVFLDEPFSGLDRRGDTVVSELLGRLKLSGTTVVMTTHLIEKGIALSDSAALLQGGRIALHEKADSATELSNLLQTPAVSPIMPADKTSDNEKPANPFQTPAPLPHNLPQ